MNGARSLHNLALIGFMGTGKSSVGRLIASALRYELTDTDHLLEQRLGLSIPETADVARSLTPATAASTVAPPTRQRSPT